MKLIECPVCGEKALGLRTGPGRTMKHRNMEVEVPSDFPLAECSKCGARPIDYRTAKKLNPILQAAFEARLASAAEADLATLSAIRPLYDWERILNLSAGYLAKIRGAKIPGAQLVALLRLLANHPDLADELDTLWAGTRARR